MGLLNPVERCRCPNQRGEAPRAKHKSEAARTGEGEARIAVDEPQAASGEDVGTRAHGPAASHRDGQKRGTGDALQQ
ncbi:hypothetical protein D9M69_163990 [compost metagenome]